MKNLLLALVGLLLFSGPVLAQSDPAAQRYTAAAYRERALGGPEHARLVRSLLRYELQHIRRFIRSEVWLQRKTFTFTLQNRATLAEVTGGQYLVRFYNANGQLLAEEPGHFGHIPPTDNQNVEVRYAPPAGATSARMELTELHAE